MKTRTALAALLFLAALMAACGGGEDEEVDDGRAQPGPVDCKARPVVCA